MFRPLLTIVILLIATSAFAAPPTPADIQQAIRELGDKQFAVREKASEFLWAAGPVAESTLEEAARTQSGEIGRRARGVLERFQWGLFADTPKVVADQIAAYRGGDCNVRMQAVAKLVAYGRPGYSAILRFANREAESERERIFEQVCASAKPILANFMLANDIVAADELLELCLFNETQASPRTDYTAFHFLCNSLPRAIEKWENTWTKTKSPLAAKTLIHLYLVQGDFTAALDRAKQLENEAWVDAVLWEKGDWKQLAAQPELAAASDCLSLGAQAAYQRRAGDIAVFEKTIAKIKRLGDSNASFTVKTAAQAMLLNGRVRDAMTLLAEKKSNAPMLFELLRTQMKFREALVLAREARGLESEEQFTLDVRRARLQYDLGQKDDALQIYKKLGESLTDIGQTNSARELMRSMVGRGLNDPAAECIAKYLAVLVENDAVLGAESLLEPLFGNRAESALIWFRFVFQRKKEDSAVKSMKSVQAMFAGKPVARCEDWAKELVETAEDRPTWLLGIDVGPPKSPAKLDLVTAALAAAEVAFAVGNDRLATEYFALAANSANATSAALIRYGDFLVGKALFREAAAVYAKSAKLDAEIALPVFLQGCALVQGGDPKEGKRLIELSHWLPLGSEKQRCEFAQELEKRGFAEDARRECQLVFTVGWQQDYVPKVINQSIRLAIRTKDFAAVVALREKEILSCLRLGAEFADASMYLKTPEMIAQFRARLMLSEGRVDEALKLIRLGLDVLPGQTEAAVEAIAALDARNRKNDADELFARMRDVCVRLSTEYPNSAFVHNSIAWLCATCRRDLDSGLVHAQTAVKLEPAAAKYLNSLAEVHFRSGEREKAVESMKKCLAMEPKSGYYRKQLERFQRGDPASAMPKQDDD